MHVSWYVQYTATSHRLQTAHKGLSYAFLETGQKNNVIKRRNKTSVFLHPTPAASAPIQFIELRA